ncbi:hypothetical protein SGRIM128S_05324 [Streptomyces griseomycini]
MGDERRPLGPSDRPAVEVTVDDHVGEGVGDQPGTDVPLVTDDDHLSDVPLRTRGEVDGDAVPAAVVTEDDPARRADEPLHGVLRSRLDRRHGGEPPRHPPGSRVGDVHLAEGKEFAADGVVRLPVVVPVLVPAPDDLVQGPQLGGQRHAQARLGRCDLLLGGAHRVREPFAKGALQQFHVRGRGRYRVRHRLGQAAHRLGQGPVREEERARVRGRDTRLRGGGRTDQVQPDTAGSGRGLHHEGDTVAPVLLERFDDPAHGVELLLVVGDQ